MNRNWVESVLVNGAQSRPVLLAAATESIGLIWTKI